MQALGSLMSAWILWEKALVPSLISGARTWLGDCTKAAELFYSIQQYYLRIILSVPKSTPKIAMQAEMNAIGFKWRIWLEKCILLRRIRTKEETTLAKMVYEQSIKNSWPGLGKYVKNICLKLAFQI